MVNNPEYVPNKTSPLTAPIFIWEEVKEDLEKLNNDQSNT
jgi:hypothetical protein